MRTVVCYRQFYYSSLWKAPPAWRRLPVFRPVKGEKTGKNSICPIDNPEPARYNAGINHIKPMGIIKKGERGNVRYGLLYGIHVHVWLSHVHGLPCFPIRAVLLPGAVTLVRGLGQNGVSPEDLIGVLRLFYF